MAKGTIEINEDRCKGCALCSAYCPVHGLELSTGFNAQGHHPVKLIKPEKCTGCAICAWMCPDCAITVYKEER